jgi:hypothetical protein
MKLELLTLCDYAKAESTGKLYIIGAFDHIYANQAPVPVPPCAIVSRLRFEASEQGPKGLAISFVDSDGVKMMPDATVQMTIQVPTGESTAAANVVLTLPQLNLPRFGEYAIDLTVDSRLEGSIPLYVHRAPQANPSGRPVPGS